MIESELSSLELQVDNFVKSFQQLTIENNSLRKEVAHLNHDRAALLNKKKKIAASLRKIITQLQDELSQAQTSAGDTNLTKGVSCKTQ